MTFFGLSSKERRALEIIVAAPGNADQLRRAQALVWLDDMETVEEVAQRLGVCRQSVYNWAARFQMRGELDITARLLDGQRSGRPRSAHGVIEPLISGVIDLDPRQIGLRSTVWTAPLLREYLFHSHGIRVSENSVRLAIKRLNLRWKRPRHSLALRSRTWRQAKGG